MIRKIRQVLVKTIDENNQVEHFTEDSIVLESIVFKDQLKTVDLENTMSASTSDGSITIPDKKHESSKKNSKSSKKPSKKSSKQD